MDKEINNNGYDYVDLGLPSGTLWATCNVGASKPSDYGLYFQWGDTVGYKDSQVGIGKWKKKFGTDWNDYKWNPNCDGLTFTKYAAEGVKLELEDDAAHVHMRGNWHIPTPTQIRELLNNTTSTWTTQDGVNGRLFTSKKYTSKPIFIPAAGCAYDGSVCHVGYEAYIWSSMLGTDYVSDGKFLTFISDYIILHGDYRCCGFSVRGVIG